MRTATQEFSSNSCPGWGSRVEQRASVFPRRPAPGRAGGTTQHDLDCNRPAAVSRGRVCACAGWVGGRVSSV